MITRRNALVVTAALFGAAAGLALPKAAEAEPFDAAAFDAALAAGKPIVVEITAPWCPICKIQKPALGKLLADPRYKGLTLYEIDFDSGKDQIRKLGATSQSTLIVFKDGKEVGRSVGETQPEWIADLLDKAVS